MTSLIFFSLILTNPLCSSVSLPLFSSQSSLCFNLHFSLLLFPVLTCLLLVPLCIYSSNLLFLTLSVSSSLQFAYHIYLFYLPSYLHCYCLCTSLISFVQSRKNSQIFLYWHDFGIWIHPTFSSMQTKHSIIPTFRNVDTNIWFWGFLDYLLS
jgi:hypothetical protein